TPIVVGGTGLYLRAALTDLALRPPPPDELRERWERELAERGPAALHAHLARRAPWAADRIDPRDRSRIVRSLELLELGELEPPRRRGAGGREPVRGGAGAARRRARRVGAGGAVRGARWRGGAPRRAAARRRGRGGDGGGRRAAGG